jgi:hypothetical protein
MPGKYRDEYYNAFVSEGYNDLSLLLEFNKSNDEDLEVLVNECKMKRIHAQRLLTDIQQLQLENEQFQQWLLEHKCEKYRQIFKKSGYVTLNILQKHVQSCTDFVLLLGVQNKNDGIRIWKLLPKNKNQGQKQNQGQEDNNEEDDHIPGATPTPNNNNSNNNYNFSTKGETGKM